MSTILQEHNLAYTRSFFLIKKVGLLILSLYSLTTTPILDKKTHFLFHLSPTNLKHSIHRCFSGERFVLQPITASITYHLSPSTLNPRLLYPQLTCYSLFHYLKQRVSRRETKCFTPRNQVFHALELIVSSNRNFSFPPLKL